MRTLNFRRTRQSMRLMSRSYAKGGDTERFHAEVTESIHHWIRDVVHGKDLCPFALKSTYDIVLSSSNSIEDNTNLVIEQAEKLVAEPPGGKFRSSLIVFPLPEELFSNRTSMDLYFNVIRASEGLIGALENLQPQDSHMKLQAVPFSSAQWPDRGQHILQMYAPWSLIQLLRYTDLERARGENEVKTIEIRKRNMDLTSSMPPQVQFNLIRECLETSKTKMIQMTRPMEKPLSELRVKQKESKGKKPGKRRR